MVPFRVSSQRRSSSVPHSLSFLLLPPLEGRVVLWEFSFDALVVLLGVHGRQGASKRGVDVLSGGGGRRGRGGAVGLGPLSLVSRVLVCGGRGGYGAWWHGVVGLLRFCGLLVGF